MKKILMLLSLINILLFLSCCKDDVPYMGRLKGDIKYTGASNMKVDNVIISLYRVVDNHMEEEMSERLTEEGEYDLELPAGTYKMYLKGNRCKSDELPFEVTIKAGETRIKKINIEQLPNSIVILYNDIEYKSGDTITLSGGMALDIWNKHSSNNLQWNIRAYPQPSWITFEGTKGSVAGGGRKSVVFSIDKNKMPNDGINYADIILTTVDNGSFTVKISAIRDGFVELSMLGISVQRQDISKSADHSSAITLCTQSRLGGFNDWRLPARGELSALYNHKDMIGGFEQGGWGGNTSKYWSLSLCKEWGNDNEWYYHDFYMNLQSSSYDWDEFCVRCVRDITK